MLARSAAMMRLAHPRLRAAVARRWVSRTATADGTRPTVLCILDGWGYTEEHPEHNAVKLALTPNFDHLMATYPHALLEASEEAVGLPKGQFGNSEVGHMNIGAGRVIYQDILRIRNGFNDGSLRKSEAFTQHVARLKASGGTSHIMGLTSDGGVHGMQEYMARLANEVHAAGVPVVVHVFTDGRDTPPQDAVESLPRFLSLLDKGVVVGTVTGRFYAMDRDTRWERVGAAYDVIVHARAQQKQADPLQAVKSAYAAGLTDEFVAPTVIGGYAGMKDGDGILMTNFRADRAREILQFLCDPAAPAAVPAMGFGTPERPKQVKFADVAGIVEYSSKHNK
jgi:2,3-bisphosphoglycerate-independent phosphoglycerate mutase